MAEFVDPRISSRKRALVIVGAGGSLQFGAPSTTRLTELVQERVADDDALGGFGGDQAYTQISETLANYLTGGSAAVNFEHIFHCAQELLSMTFEPTPGAVDEFRPILYPFVGRWVALKERDALTALVRGIPKILFDELSAASDNPAVPLTPLANFIDNLRETHVTRIYTTNYDDFILQAVPALYHGFDPTPGPGPKRFELESFWASTANDCVFHLHGSVHFGFPPPSNFTDDLNTLHWFHDRSDARPHSSYDGSPERQMDGTVYLPSTLITGFDKLSRMQQTPQSHYYASFAHDVTTADVIFVIGFSLADLHITARLAEARRRRPSPPLLFVDFWKGSFLENIRRHEERKNIEMFHALRMFIVGDAYRDRATTIPPAWTVANDGSCAVWGGGFLEFLDALDTLPGVMARMRAI